MSVLGVTSSAKSELRVLGFDWLADRGDCFDEALGSEVELLEPFLFQNPAQLAFLLKHQTQEPNETANTLCSCLVKLPKTDRAKLEAVLLRALTPRAAMVTVPEENLFSEEERKVLPSFAASQSPPPRINLAQKVGHPIDYSGYLCLILKITRLCNLRCRYCNDWSDETDSTLSVELLSRVVSQALSGPYGGLDLVLHGGEPLMMGRRKFLQMLWLLARCASPEQTVRVHIQSNGTLINERWVRIFALFDIRLSVSLDGPQEMHDQSRPDSLGRPTFERAMHGIALLRDQGLFSGALLVVTRDIVRLGAEELLASLRQHQIHSVCLLAERPFAKATPDLGIDEYVQFLVDVSRTRRRQPDPWIAMREIDSLERLINNEPSGFCELAGGCVGHFVTIEADGTVSHCDKYVGDPDYQLGNLFDESLGSILSGKKTDAVRNEVEVNSIADTPICSYRHLCQGWCPHERYVAKNAGLMDSQCCGLAPIFQELIDQRADFQGD